MQLVAGGMGDGYIIYYVSVYIYYVALMFIINNDFADIPLPGKVYQI
jgi:hypothetical protein